MSESSSSSTAALSITTATGGSLKLQPGACVHLMGIGGVGMTSLAGLLVQRGFQVTGSDGPIYPPTSTLLQKLKIKPQLNYKAENLQHKPDLVVVGNVISRSNPEAQALMQQGLPYISFPQALMQFAVCKSQSVVVAGTHGKTTSTAMLVAMAQAQKSNDTSAVSTGYMIGGQPVGGASFAYHEGAPYFILEGDEYDTAFFNKVPKFMHYKAHAVLLTSVEFDHADIYDNIEQVREAFQQLVRSIPKEGVLVACTDDANVRALLPLAQCPVVTYGTHDKDRIEKGPHPLNDFEIVGREFSNDRQFVKLRLPSFERCDEWDELSKTRSHSLVGLTECLFGVLEFCMDPSGPHNALNAVGAWVMAAALGWDFDLKTEALEEFDGVQRRCQTVGSINGALVIEDFAHHPTAVRLSIQAAREAYMQRMDKKEVAAWPPELKIRAWAVFEPRSNTSRRRIFHKQYVKALSEADQVLVAPAYDQSRIAEEERLDVPQLVEDLKAAQVKARQATAEQIVEILRREANKMDVIVIMSNGSFDGLVKKLALDKSPDK